MLPDLVKIIANHHLTIEQRKKFDEDDIAEGCSAERISVESIIPDSEKENKPDSESISKDREIKNHHQIEKRNDV